MSRSTVTDVNTIESLVAAYVDAVSDLTLGSAQRYAEKLSINEARLLAAFTLLREARSSRRHDVLRTEREATRTEREALYRGKYRHGTAKAYRNGCNCDECSRMRQAMDEINDRGHIRLMEAIKREVDSFAADLRVQWTADLLRSSFAVDNSGRMVTWGSATVEEHRSRIAMLTTQATSTLETAARHKAAIATIEMAGTSTLAEATHQLTPHHTT